MNSGKLIVNLDIMFLNDFFMSIVLLWATAKFSRLRVRIWPLLASAVVGAFYTLIVIMPFFQGIAPFVLIIFVILNVLTGCLMIRIAFGRMKIKKFLSTLGNFYLITFLAGGAAISIYFIAGFSPIQWISALFKLGERYVPFYFLAVLITIFVGRYGWNFVRERFFKDKYQIKIRVRAGERISELSGLLDTGNQLRDPFSHLPVIVVKSDAVLSLFPQEIQLILSDHSLDVIDQAEKLLNSPMFNRFKIIPFSSLGHRDGLLLGYRPDSIEIIGGEVQRVENVILGIKEGELDREGEYQALLHPEILEVI